MVRKAFDLEQVLVYRREMEKLRKQEYAASKRESEKAHDELEREEEQVDELTREFHSRQKELGCIDDLRMYADYFARKREEIKSQKERVEELDLAMNERHEDLLEATKDKKVLETLKEKKDREFRMEMELKERKFLDEISVQKKVKPE